MNELLINIMQTSVITLFIGWLIIRMDLSESLAYRSLAVIIFFGSIAVLIVSAITYVWMY